MAPVKRPVVLFVLPWSLRAIGGVNQVVTHLAQQMRDAGAFEPMVLMADWDAPQPVFEEIHGLRTVRWQVRSHQGDMGIKAGLVYALWERRFRKQFTRFCQEHDVRAVNLHYPGSMAFTFERVLKTLPARVPLLLSFHGTDATNLADLSAAKKEAWRHLLARSDAVVACSQELGKRIERALAVPVRHQVIYNGVDTGKFSDGVAVPQTKQRILLHVGKFDRNKGQDVLIDAFSRIAPAHPDLLLHLVGGDGAQLASLRAQAAGLQLAERVRFFVDIPFTEIPAHFKAASVFAFPSRQEAFGLVLLEAGSCALPVVASRVGGIPELIQDGATGLLVEPDDAQALARALQTLLDDPALARGLGERLAARVAADFSWTSTRLRYEELIRDAGQAARAA
ncbi:glycosyltransferase family 4 protein [Massilia suwonensis]|uniref:Glycosyltransferase family 4 protein n=1 Tax=Massilia suwonensis TaxID=648895 RepID=A0ABW0MJ70_9BURK